MGKVAVITGANHGIGAAIAKELAFTGYHVVITWLDPEKYACSHIGLARMVHTMAGKAGADRVLREIADQGGNASSIPADLANQSDITAVLNFARREFGPVDTLVNNAAHGETNDTLESCDGGVFDRTYAINVRAPVLLVQEFLEQRIPLGRGGQPTDIARAVRFLVSEEADWITGQVLAVDGGHSWGRCL